MKSNKFYVTKNDLTKVHTPDKTQLMLGKVFRGVTHKLNSGVPFDRILDFVFDSLGLIIPFDRIGIALVDSEGKGEQICLKWIRSKLPAKHLTTSSCIPLNGSSLRRVLEKGEPRIINDLVKFAAEHPESKSAQLAIKDGIRSSMTCPLYANNKSSGIIFFSSAKTETYEQEDVRTFLEIANELSMIIEHASLKKHFENTISVSRNLSMILHDLKSPLSVVQGLLELSQIEDWYNQLSSEEKNVFSTMQRNTKYMFKLIDELSELKHLELDEKIKCEDVVLKKFLTELENNEDLLAKKMNIKLQVVFSPGCHETVRFDPVKINRVLDNLLTNAFKYSRPNTQVTVTAKTEQNRLIFEVSDQGFGIPPEEISKLFKEFGKTSVRPISGESSTGLGLAIAKKIVEQHGGEISVKSLVGQGSTFSFWLPMYIVTPKD